MTNEPKPNQDAIGDETAHFNWGQITDPDADKSQESPAQEEITVENAARYTDLLAKIKADIKYLQGRQKHLERALKAYSEKTGIKQLQGAHYAAIFKSIAKKLMPQKNTPDRTNLEMKLVELKLWEQVISLNHSMLKRKLSSEKWRAEDIEALNKFMVHKEELKVDTIPIEQNSSSSDELAHQCENIDEKIEELKSDTVETNPDEETLHELANLYFRRGLKKSTPDDHKDFNKAIEVDPDDYGICERIGTTLLNHQRHQEARPFLEKAIDRAPEEEKDRLKKMVEAIDQFIEGSRASQTPFPRNRHLDEQWPK